MPVPDIVYPAAAVAPFGPTLFKPGATCAEWMTMEKKIFDTDRRIRLGIWGLGRGQSFIRSAQFLNIDVVAGCDINPEMRASFARNVPGAFVTADEDEFLAQDIDAVLVATYFPSHAAHAIKALERGKHVMCEVTSFRSPAEGVRLVEAVERSDKVYNLLENCPFTKENMYLKQLWDEGFFGEFIYGEYEYVHSCRQLSYAYNFRVDGRQLLVEPGWVVHNWRAGLNPHLYNTHSLGPLMHITGLRPVMVEALPNTVITPGALLAPGFKSSAGASLVRMSNGGVMRNLMGSMTMDNHTGGRLWGTKAGADKMTRGHLRLCIGADGSGMKTEVVPEWPEIGRFAEKTGHGGGDFWELYYFAREILTGEKAPWNIYAACDVTITGILAARSAARGGEPQRVPDFRDKAERDAYRDDWAEDVPVFDPASVFPPDADKELVKDFDRIMVELFHNDGAQRQLYTYVQGRRLFDNLADPAAKRSVIDVARGLPALLPRMAEYCRLAQRIRDAYPDSIGGRTLDRALAHLPLDMILDHGKTSAEIADWLAKVDAAPVFGELATHGQQG